MPENVNFAKRSPPYFGCFFSPYPQSATFSRTAGGIKPDLYPCQQPSAECYGGEHVVGPQLFSPRTRQFFARKVEVMSEPLRAG